jgi:glycosyltransferase involved in cell wall biosynthesis
MMLYSNENQILFSILTPTIPIRAGQVAELTKHIQNQIQQENAEKVVEHLVLSDNMVRSIGAKRQALVDIARGQYVAFVDDDDWVMDGYVEAILDAARSHVDVITFQQRAVYNGQESLVEFKAGQNDEAFVTDGLTRRGPWHICAWRRSVVAGCQFLETNYGEDIVWARQARARIRTSKHIPFILHEYRHDSEATAAPEPGI